MFVDCHCTAQAYEDCLVLLETFGKLASPADRTVLSDAQALLDAMPNQGKPLVTPEKTIAEYTVNSVKGTVLMEPDAGHRHFSSLIGLYPLSQHLLRQGPGAVQAAANTLAYKIARGGGKLSCFLCVMETGHLRYIWLLCICELVLGYVMHCSSYKLVCSLGSLVIRSFVRWRFSLADAAISGR